MPRKAENLEQLLDRVVANGYEPGAHKLEDSVRDNTTYVDKTLQYMTRIGLWGVTSSECTSARYLLGVHPLLDSSNWLKVLEVKMARDAGVSFHPEVDKDNDIASNTSQNSHSPCLREVGPLLHLATIKEFLRFHISLSKGRIDDEKRTTVDSMNTFSEWVLHRAAIGMQD